MMKPIHRLFDWLRPGGRSAENHIQPLRPFLDGQYKLSLAEIMPTVEDALWRIMEVRDRLKHLGWTEGVYAPKTGEEFEALQIGSIGTFKAYYEKHIQEFVWWDGDSSELCGEPFMFRKIDDEDKKVQQG